MDNVEGLIIGAAAAAIVTVLVTQWINRQPWGGAAGNQPGYGANQNFGQNPEHPLYVVDLAPTPPNAAPVMQVNPNTEAAYNVAGGTQYAPAFGPAMNQPAVEAVLPQ